jgi:hypothetical protein
MADVRGSYRTRPGAPGHRLHRSLRIRYVGLQRRHRGVVSCDIGNGRECGNDLSLQRDERAEREPGGREPQQGRQHAPPHRASSGRVDLAVVDDDGNWRQRPRSRASQDRPGLRIEAAAMARAADRPIPNRTHRAALVGAHRREPVHRAVAATGEHDPRIGKYQPATGTCSRSASRRPSVRAAP